MTQNPTKNQSKSSQNPSRIYLAGVGNTIPEWFNCTPLSFHFSQALYPEFSAVLSIIVHHSPERIQVGTIHDGSHDLV